MPRKPREWTPGATYHIMSRGNYRQAIFHDDGDHKVFLSLLGDCSKKYECVIHAYCLMTNHFHLLLETGKVPIWTVMDRMLNRYAKYHNVKYHVDGHLFKSRYKSCLVTTDAYFLQTSRYIHLNPVKAHMVKTPGDHPYSSFGDYIGIRWSGIVDTRKTLRYFRDRNVDRYRKFVEDTRLLKVDLQIREQLEDEETTWLPW